MPSFMSISAMVQEVISEKPRGRDKTPGGQGLTHAPLRYLLSSRTRLAEAGKYYPLLTPEPMVGERRERRRSKALNEKILMKALNVLIKVTYEIKVR